MYIANLILANPYVTLIVLISILILSYLMELHGNAYLSYPNITLSTSPYNNRSMSAAGCCCVMLTTSSRSRDRGRGRCKGRDGPKERNGHGHVRRSKCHQQAYALLWCDDTMVHPSSPGRRNDCDRSRMFFSGGMCGVGGRFDACKGWDDTFVCTWCNSWRHRWPPWTQTLYTLPPPHPYP